MYIEDRLFSENTEETLYSVLMDEDEYALYSEFQKEFGNKLNKILKNDKLILDHINGMKPSTFRSFIERPRADQIYDARWANRVGRPKKMSKSDFFTNMNAQARDEIINHPGEFPNGIYGKAGNPGGYQDYERKEAVKILKEHLKAHKGKRVMDNPDAW
jgi:hypothetical protein